MTWVLAGVGVLAVALAFALGGGGDDSSRAPAPEEQVSAETAVVESFPSAAAPSSTTEPNPLAPSKTTTTLDATTSTPSTTSTLAATTATTAPPAMTTTSAVPVPDSDASGYTPVLKPSVGPNAIAPGGALTKHLAGDIAIAFGLDTDEVEAAIAEVDLPPEAAGNPEGWLAPGTYQPAADAGAMEVVQAMVDRRIAQLEQRNVPRDQWHRVLTAASVIEKETYNQNEKPYVARVLANRLAGGGPLQMDSIILYPVPEDRIFTTSDERSSDQPYNSYRYNGLPPTPICSPDDESIDAFLSPLPGVWWFYVTIDLHSGETRYAVTYVDHQANVELLRAWLRDNPTP